MAYFSQFMKPPVSIYGYFMGGTNGSVNFSTTDRMLFSDAILYSNTVSNLSQEKTNAIGVSDCSVYGYLGGGALNTTDRLVFSTSVTSANTVSNLSQYRNGSGSSDGHLYGYFAAGGTLNTTDRIVFSTGVTSVNTVSNLPQNKSFLSGLSDYTTYGYFAGGYTGSAITVFTTDRIVFSTGATSANTVSNISSARYGLTALSDCSYYGYFAGGYANSYVDTTDRIVFSTGATSANTVSNLSITRYGLASSSDGSTYGYFAGGSPYSGTRLSSVDRIEFSTGVTYLNTVSNISNPKSALSGISDHLV